MGTNDYGMGFDIKDYDNYWCSADVGWITGHTYVVYGPLACGATTIMHEGTPTYPNSGRWWRMIEEYQISKLHFANCHKNASC